LLNEFKTLAEKVERVSKNAPEAAVVLVTFGVLVGAIFSMGFVFCCIIPSLDSPDPPRRAAAAAAKNGGAAAPKPAKPQKAD
jgi:hypothetical protein